MKGRCPWPRCSLCTVRMRKEKKIRDRALRTDLTFRLYQPTTILLPYSVSAINDYPIAYPSRTTFPLHIPVILRFAYIDFTPICCASRLARFPLHAIQRHGPCVLPLWTSDYLALGQHIRNALDFALRKAQQSQSHYQSSFNNGLSIAANRHPNQ